MNTNVNNIKNGYTIKLLKFILSSIAVSEVSKEAKVFVEEIIAIKEVGVTDGLEKFLFKEVVEGVTVGLLQWKSFSFPGDPPTLFDSQNWKELSPVLAKVNPLLSSPPISFW